MSKKRDLLQKIGKKIKNFSFFLVFSDFIYMKQSKNLFVTAIILAALAAPILFPSCQSLNKIEKERITISRRLLAKGQLTADQLARFFIGENDQETYDHIYNFACLYIDEAAAENINSDIAFAQMCLETGFLRYGGLVQPEWHNYCGLGAISPQEPGCIFETEELGVRAHIQHIQAYATKEDVKLNRELVDPRYNWVHKTKFAVTMGDLALSWAADPDYAPKLNRILTRMEDSLN